MANIERTVSCPPQLSVDESSEGSCDDIREIHCSDNNDNIDKEFSSSNDVSPVKSSSEMLRGVDMTELGTSSFKMINCLFKISPICQ